MGTSFLVSVKSLVRTPSVIVWVLAFPLIMSAIFLFMFSGMRTDGVVDPVPVALVAPVDEKDDASAGSFTQVVKALAEPGEDQLLDLRRVGTADEAEVLLASGEIDGYFEIASDGAPALTVGSAYTLASQKTGKKYLLRFSGRQLNVIERTVTPQSVILQQGTNLQTATYGESIENMKNRVIIVDSEGKFLRSISDDDAVRRYGLLADVLTQQDGEDATAEAKEILEDNGVEQRASVTCLGHTKLITGNTIYISEPYTGMHRTCWIDEDTHVWQNGVYTCRLTLNFKNEMREGESGREVDE